MHVFSVSSLTLLLEETVASSSYGEKMNTVLEVKDLTKSYNKLVAVENFNLTVARGEIFGLIGHNGAGKSTVIECILGTRRIDSGSISILGFDPVCDRKRIFAKVGVQFQQTGFQEKLRVNEACEVTASLYPGAKNWYSLLARFGLGDKGKTNVAELSGGERQKLAIALALIPEPELLFLDELTTGLDPAARREIWNYLKELKNSGVTIVLTSHFMDEVEFLCNRIAIMKKGKTVLSGVPAELISSHQKKNLEDVFLMYMENDEIREDM